MWPVASGSRRDFLTMMDYTLELWPQIKPSFLKWPESGVLSRHNRNIMDNRKWSLVKKKVLGILWSCSKEIGVLSLLLSAFVLLYGRLNLRPHAWLPGSSWLSYIRNHLLAVYLFLKLKTIICMGVLPASTSAPCLQETGSEHQIP